MPRLFPGSAEQIIARSVLDPLGLFLAQYGQRQGLSLMTEADYPVGPLGLDQFWGLIGPSLAVVLVVGPVQEDADLRDLPPDSATLQLLMDPDGIRIFLEAVGTALDNPEQCAQLASLGNHLGHGDPAAQAQFMLDWLNFCTTAMPPTCKPVQDRLDRQLERSLVLNQVVTKIQESLDLSVILQTTVSEVRYFLQADRLLIYQFALPQQEVGAETDQTIALAPESAPGESVPKEFATEKSMLGGSREDEKANHRGGYITYEAKSNETLSSVLHYTENFCFSQSPACQERFFSGQTTVVDNIDDAYASVPCLHAFLTQVGVKSKMVVPILVGQQFWGLLIVHQCQQQRHWEAWEIEFLGHIAEHLAIAINQAQLYQQLQQQTQNLEVCVIERTQDLRDALAAAQAANRAKSDFLATMSHELRTPLTYIIGMSATLLRWSLGDLSERQRDYLNTIHTSGEHLLAVINDILEVSKIESGRTALEVREFSLTSLSRQSVDAFRAEAAKNDLDVVLDLKIAPDQDSFVADPRRVRQILSNLISNAVKFTPAAGKVTLRVRREQNVAVFDISDTGIGIPESAQSLLFEKFQQLENVRQREYQGTGLGLALTKQLVDLHGGSIKVVSKVGVGSLFSVRIPLQRSDSALPPPSAPEVEPVVGRIVLVEDNEENASIICDMLTAADYQVIWIVDGSRVLDQVELLQPAAVIINLNLASANSYDIITALGQTLGHRGVKILALVNGASSDQAQRAQQAGAHDTLPHPVNPKQLLTAVYHLMRHPALG
ncbi:ATP-binding protein [Phormidium sp. FACHB-1136]|uniref:hybrid sensor histidine kinase/response regulator n=1 Tax=Phormidium sp. FACHB-1136 TaxID=2692848 RepID=UPI001687303D|nr:ATP-binding protein [Phormidium sp. FACHB-1136]MBD2425161.1 GAF domain-containing protein [Phormidium sp. FACHB-1136]